ncbi:L-ribulose-5-phosphate 4-epimerase AraD [Meiothermus granaticius]|uniref:L-ribulose-5-phosphate 4-epimerase AraD n=1 Tax=Meiothermus granaticius TaxID=863370 RepID=UPI001F0CA80B|nr:L-ribulose-5-phosphate 4-epimerase AraD [Meiothermus granaticius]
MIAKELREQALEANLALPRQGLVVFTWGNASAYDPAADLLAIKPSGVPYEDLTAQSMVLVEVSSGRVVEGNLRPSSDTPTHLVLAQEFGVGGIVHTHSRYATVWAQAGLDLPCYGTTQADYFSGIIPCTRDLRPEEISQGYEHYTGLAIVEEFHRRRINPTDVPAVLLRNHASFVWGKNAGEAVHNAVVLEEVAQMALYARLLNPNLREIPAALLEKHYRRKHGPDAYYGQKKL